VVRRACVRPSLVVFRSFWRLDSKEYGEYTTEQWNRRVVIERQIGVLWGRSSVVRGGLPF
jgi:hypothetical protein